MRYIFRILFIISLFTWVAAQDESDSAGESFAKVGTSGAHFLSISPDARFSAMGNASIGFKNNSASAVFYNPATLVFTENMNGMISNVDWLADIHYYAGAFAYKLNRRSAVAFHYRALDSGDMEERTVNQPEGTGRQFSWKDMAVGGSYATFLTDRFAFGANIYYVRESVDLDDYVSSTWAVDLGTFYQTGFRSLKLGMSIRNFGSELDFDENFDDYDGIGGFETDPEPFRSYHMPLIFQVGVTYEFLTDDDTQALIIGLDGVHPNDTDERLNIGAEYNYENMLYARAGLYTDHDSARGFFGFGLNLLKFSQQEITFDYARADYGIIGFVNQFSIGYQL